MAVPVTQHALLLAARMAALASALLHVSVVASSLAMPDASECLVCAKCFVDGRTSAGGIEAPDVDPDSPLWNKYLPEADPNSHKPKCNECKGCTAVAAPLVPVLTFKNFSLGSTEGHSSASIFRISSTQAKGGYAIGKIWCIPMAGHSCTDMVAEYVNMTMEKILAVDRVGADCGFDDIVPRSWVETVTTIIPGLGYVYHGKVLMMEVAGGVSFKALDKLPAKIQSEVYGSLNRTQMLLAGIFDTLIQQRDRNTGNAFLSESNRLSLIDNDKVLGGTIDSAFLPNTAYYNTAVFGRVFVRYNGFNASKAPVPSAVRTSVALDYRCYTQGGVVGTRFPPRVTACLKRIVTMTPEQIQEKYGFRETPMFPGYGLKYSKTLLDSATALLHHGMEWTLEHSLVEHRCQRYFWHKPCCRWRPTRPDEVAEYGRRMRCADESWSPWALEHKLPCRGFDYMYIKYRMMDESSASCTEYNNDEWLAYVRRKAPPVRCTNAQAQTQDADPWVLHTFHREVDPTLYCAKYPGGRTWRRYIDDGAKGAVTAAESSTRHPRL